jgi:hypothetical protein
MSRMHYRPEFVSSLDASDIDWSRGSSLVDGHRGGAIKYIDQSQNWADLYIGVLSKMECGTSESANCYGTVFKLAHRNSHLNKRPYWHVASRGTAIILVT